MTRAELREAQDLLAERDVIADRQRRLSAVTAANATGSLLFPALAELVRAPDLPEGVKLAAASAIAKAVRDTDGARSTAIAARLRALGVQEV